MAADRVLAKTCDRPPAAPDVAAERKRAADALTAVVDDLLAGWRGVAHPVATPLVEGFTTELVKLLQFVRSDDPLEKFLEAREVARAG